MRISDWSSDVCSSDLGAPGRLGDGRLVGRAASDLDVLQVDVRGDVDPGPGGRNLHLDRERRGREYHVSPFRGRVRSEEHTSELQSLMRTSYAVFCLKKKIKCSIY